jgi:hypothetical protein
LEVLASIFPRLGFVLALLLECGALQTRAAEISKEAQIKAVCLWRLAQYVQWPTNAFQTTNSPIVIGVLGEDPFGGALKVAVQGETAQGRGIEVKQFDRLQDALVFGVHILFISASETKRLDEILTALRGRSILTVSDIEYFPRQHHGMVRISVEQGKLKLRINLDAANAAHLLIDARLLRMAEIIREP